MSRDIFSWIRLLRAPPNLALNVVWNEKLWLAQLHSLNMTLKNPMDSRLNLNLLSKDGLQRTWKVMFLVIDGLLSHGNLHIGITLQMGMKINARKSQCTAISMAKEQLCLPLSQRAGSSTTLGKHPFPRIGQSDINSFLQICGHQQELSALQLLFEDDRRTS